VLVVDKPNDLKQYVGKEIGASEWVTVDQQMIDKFAEATGDYQWIHVDVARCKKEMPNGTTIAHGYLSLSLLPIMSGQVLDVTNKSRGLNYGSNKVRFTGMVPAGSRLRGHMTLKEANDVKGDGIQMIAEWSMEMEGAERPVLIAEAISIVYP
jgi:acyl dehydratase